MRTLLLVDESITVQRVIALTFAEQDIQVVSVPDGRQAMEKMAAQKPDIVLAGTSLPQVSGYDLAQFMRSKPDLKDVPVLLLSGAFELVDDARLMASGANGVLEKPVEPTVVIGRVKELLGLKSDDKPAATPGRTITPAITPSDKKPTAPAPRAVTAAKPEPSNWEQLRDQTGLDRNTKSVEETATRGDYLDTLDAAFDTLDQQLSGRTPVAKAPRNPAGPLGHADAASEPASHPADRSRADNPVFEVDDDWFGDRETSHADATVASVQMTDDLRDPVVVPPAAPQPETPVFEVDDQWFAEGNKARDAKAAEQQQLAAEMGVHELNFGDADRNNKTETHPAAPVPAPELAVASEQTLPATVIKVVTPDVTDEMLDQIAARVADRLSAGPFGEQLRNALTSTLRDSVNQTVGAAVGPAVSETSERMVREVVAHTVEGTVREAVSQSAERAVREVVAETTERVVREVVSATADRAVREVIPEIAERVVRDVVTQTTERAVPDAVSQTTERVVREIVPAAAERVVREAVAEATQRVVPEAVAQTTERVVREIVPQVTERVVREIVPEAADRLARDVVPQTADRAVREIVLETSERLVRDEIERIKSKSRN